MKEGKRSYLRMLNFSVCSFECIIQMARWLSWLERRPVTAEVVGSNPIRVAKKEKKLIRGGRKQ